MDTTPDQPADIHFVRITTRTVEQICKLSETLTPNQRRMVTDNALSIAQAHFSEDAWMRAIYANDVPVGFIMLHYGSDYDDGIDCPGAFLWRLMIARPWQGKGYGKAALKRLVRQLQEAGYSQLYTSSGQGEESPYGFYTGLGFRPTGDHYDDQPELLLKFEDWVE